MQIEISASSRNPTCEISPVVQLLLAPSLYVCVSAFFLPVRSRRHSCICDVPTCLPICLCPAMNEAKAADPENFVAATGRDGRSKSGYYYQVKCAHFVDSNKKRQSCAMGLSIMAKASAQVEERILDLPSQSGPL